jgi:uncharacterized membrane protein
MHIAVKTKDLNINSHSIAGVINRDRIFTIPGVIVITIGVFLTAIHGSIPILRTGWIFWSLILFSISGIAFAVKVVPLQRRIHEIVNNGKVLKQSNGDQFTKTYIAWEIWGLIALITPIAALIMMVLEIPGCNSSNCNRFRRALGLGWLALKISL